MSPEDLTVRLKAEAQRLGFDLAGATAAVVPPRIGALRQWLADGFAGEMEYIPRRAAAYEHPRHVLDGAVSLLMLAMAYRTQEPAEPAPGQGQMARYAWGTDYHDVIRERLHALADFHRGLTPGAAVRGVVNTAPLLEREFAELAGLGWVGKNTLLLNRQFGSWFFLAALLTSETLVYDQPLATGHCGTCRACIDGCPTHAIVEPYRLDARKCISYLTIELRGPIPPEQRAVDWLADLRLRHLPRRLSLQSSRAANRRAGLSAATRFESDRSGGIVAHGRRGLCRAIPRQPGVAGQAARAALPGRLRARDSAGSQCLARIN